MRLFDDTFMSVFTIGTTSCPMVRRPTSSKQRSKLDCLTRVDRSSILEKSPNDAPRIQYQGRGFSASQARRRDDRVPLSPRNVTSAWSAKDGLRLGVGLRSCAKSAVPTFGFIHGRLGGEQGGVEADRLVEIGHRHMDVQELHRWAPFDLRFKRRADFQSHSGTLLAAVSPAPGSWDCPNREPTFL